MEWARRLAVAGVTSAIAAAPVMITAGSAAAGTDQVITRVTARSSAVKDGAGQTWGAGASSFVAARTSTALSNKDVVGTTDDVLYRIAAFGMSSYSSQVPSSGTYRVRLLMAETYWTKRGERVFSVLAEGEPAATDVDLVAEAGYATAHERTFDVAVADGTLDLTFLRQVDNPVVSAIEVTRLADAPNPTATPTPTPTSSGASSVDIDTTTSTSPPTSSTSSAPPTSSTPTTPSTSPTSSTTTTSEPLTTPTAPPLSEFVVRTSAQPTAVQDVAGHTWSSRAGFIGATKFNSTYVGQDVAGTTDDPLYQVTAFDFGGFSTPVPAQGRYTVTVLMMEPYFQAKGQRVFDITAEGKTVIADIDIHKAVGIGTAYQRSVVVPVRDGQLDLGFVRKIDLPLVSAIKVTYLDQHVNGPPAETGPGTTGLFAHRETARDGAVTDEAGHVWQPRSVRWGSWKRSSALVGSPISGTEDDILYQVNGFGITRYRLSVPAEATYRVRLLMAESYWTTTGSRVFDVSAEGTPMATGIDIVKAAGGLGIAHDVSFEVPVSDGELNLDFVATVDLALVSAIEVVSTDVVDIPAQAPVRQAVTFGPGNFWTQDISAAPVAADSTPVVANLVEQVADRNGGIAALNAHHHNASFHVVPAGQPRITVNYWKCQNKEEIPWGLFDGPAHFVNVPVPDDAVAAAGTDASMTVYDPDADQLWEFWQMRRDSTTNEWEACWGGRLDAVSTRQGFFPMYFGASASGTVIAGGMVTIDEFRRGEINHAVAVGVPDAKAGMYSWPAQRTDGAASGDVVMEGQRLRLDPSLDLSQYPMTPVARMIATAAQKYGLIITDHSGVVAVGTEAGLLQASRTGKNPWDDLLAGAPHEAMKGFPWHKLQALPKDWGKPS